MRATLHRKVSAPERFAAWLKLRLGMLDVSYADALDLLTAQWHKLGLAGEPPDEHAFARRRKRTTNPDEVWRLGRAIRGIEIDRGYDIADCASGLVALLAAGAYTDFAAIAAIEFDSDSANDGSAGAVSHRLCSGMFALPRDSARTIPVITRVLPGGSEPAVEIPDYDRWLFDEELSRTTGIVDDLSFLTAYELWSAQRTFHVIPTTFHPAILLLSHPQPNTQTKLDKTMLGLAHLERIFYLERLRKGGMMFELASDLFAHALDPEESMKLTQREWVTPDDSNA